MIGPTAAEAASIEFIVPGIPTVVRYVIALALFTAGVVLAWFDVIDGVLGIPIVLLGHVPLWVKSQTTAPGGATPLHEDAWVPVEEGWQTRVRELEDAGERWDVSPWDISSWRGVISLVMVTMALFAVGRFVSPGRNLALFVALGCSLFMPLWFNGMRSTWNPSELMLKGRALWTAETTLRDRIGSDFDLVPLLAMREGREGRYPVDARAMVRPASGASDELIGVQVQVAMNNVRGTDYPYLYCVVLMKRGDGAKRKLERLARRKKSMVYEYDRGDDVDYLVVRQHADNSGGWHTGDGDINRIVKGAMRIAVRLV